MDLYCKDYEHIQITVNLNYRNKLTTAIIKNVYYMLYV